MRNYLRSFFTREAAGQISKLAVIGVVNTVVDFALFNVFAFRLGMSLTAAVALAFGLATLGSYLLNRRWTFQIRTGWGSFGETGRFLAVNLGAVAVTELFVVGADRWFGPLGVWGANLAKLAATAVILVPKFAGYRDLVFRRSLANERRS